MSSFHEVSVTAGLTPAQVDAFVREPSNGEHRAHLDTCRRCRVRVIAGIVESPPTRSVSGREWFVSAKQR